MSNPSIDCLSYDAVGRVRIQLPLQNIETAFGKILGASSLSVAAAAEAELTFVGDSGGVMPFGILGNASDGELVCLRSASDGTATPPCDGSDTGNFHALNVDLYGHPTIGTPTICGGNKNTKLPYNIRVGVDHVFRKVTPAQWASGLGGPFDVDGCFQALPQQFDTYTGLGSALTAGVADTTVSLAGHPADARLAQGPMTNTRELKSGSDEWELDNQPLWNYLQSNGTGLSECDPTNVLYNSVDDAGEAATAEITACLHLYVTTNQSAQIFSDDIGESPRALIIPQMWEAAWPSGGSNNRTLKGFRFVWLQGTMFNCNAGGCDVDFQPGEDEEDICFAPGPNCQQLNLHQLTGFLITENMIPFSEVFGDGGDELVIYRPVLAR